jgi:hypothetical protein
LLTSSQRACRLPYSLSFEPVFTSVNPRVQTAGACYGDILHRA